MLDSVSVKNINQKSIFVSYSWDSDEHKNRVFKFVSKLRSKGFDVIFDDDMMYGDRITHFMEKSVAESDIVLFICTPEYKQRADGRKGGVGYENAIITGELYETQNERKFIPVLFSGSWTESMPNWAKGKLGIDLRIDDNDQYENLLHTINRYNNTASIPPLATTAPKSIKIYVTILIIIVIITLLIFIFYQILLIKDNMASSIEEMELRLERQLDMIYNIETSISNTEYNAYNNIELTPYSSSTPSHLLPLSQFTNEIIVDYTSVDVPLSNTMLLDMTTPIACNIDTGQEYTAKELADQLLLFTYNRDEQEIFFLGRFNEEGQLDGRCIVNVYEENKLILITDTEYNNGNLLKYEQIFPCATTTGTSVWAVTKHIPDNGFSETWYYFHNEDYNQVFDSNNVTPENIIAVSEFFSRINGTLEGYYYGNTSNGYFNDHTGNAYMVKFSEDGTVMALYVGNFEDGQLTDSTGNAWLIAKGDTNYYYYKGTFFQGEMLDKKAIEAISQNKIEEIVDKLYFNCELNWSNFDA